MPEINVPNAQRKSSFYEICKDAVMIVLILVFIALYAAAFTGKLDPLKDNTLILRLEPVIFIFIGYYLGRFPSKRSEHSLKEEITRQINRAEAAQFAKEKLQIEREQLEEKIKNARTALKNLEQSETTLPKNTLKTVTGILDL